MGVGSVEQMPYTFREWMREQFDRDELRDIAHYGCDAGWGGLTYYSDTRALYEEYDDEIWRVVGEMADMYGSFESPLHFITEVTKLDPYDDSTFKNGMVWLVAEHYANELAEDDDEWEEDEEDVVSECA